MHYTRLNRSFLTLAGFVLGIAALMLAVSVTRCIANVLEQSWLTDLCNYASFVLMLVLLIGFIATGSVGLTMWVLSPQPGRPKREIVRQMTESKQVAQFH